MIASFVVGLLVLAPVALAATDDSTVSMTATVDSFAEWSVASASIAAGDWTGSVSGTSINEIGETLTVTKAMAIYASTNVALSAAAGTNSGIATNGTETLTTSYKITGDVGTPDASWKAAGSGAGEFFEAANTYTVAHTPGDGSYTINLLVQLESAADRAQDAGDYTCSLTVTATW